MSDLESIVPRSALCKRIPAGWFDDSALVWVIKGDHEECAPRTMFKAIPNSWRLYPAPTLEELHDALVETGAFFCSAGLCCGGQYYMPPTKAKEALKLYLKLKGVR